MMRVFDHRSGSRLAALALALGCACVAPTLHAQGQPTTGPDVTRRREFDTSATALLS